MESVNPFGSVYQVPERIIVHAMAEWFRVDGKIISAAEMLLKLRLSAHVLVFPNGHRMRLREDKQGAWHAKNHNTNSLGIEFLVPGIHDYGSFLEAIKVPYLTLAAHASGIAQVRHWLEQHSITAIDRHSDIDPTRKKDPGDGFPWFEFLEELK